MTGFWVLASKELLELRRTWKFLAMAAVFTLVGVLAPSIGRIVAQVQGHPHGTDEARDILRSVAGDVIPALGVFLAIIATSGSLAGERASGTAAMTLTKPVTRAAFVAAKFFVLAVSVYGAVLIAGAVTYLLTLVLFGDGGLGRFILGLLVSATFLLFIGSLTLFWSSMFSRQLLVSGLAFGIFIALQVLSNIPDTRRFWPVVGLEFSNHVMVGDTYELWPGFVIACGLVFVLSLGAWAVFRQKEL